MGSLQYASGLTEGQTQSCASLHDKSCVGEACKDHMKCADLPANVHNEVKNDMTSPESEMGGHKNILSNTGSDTDTADFKDEKNEAVVHDNGPEYENSIREEQGHDSDQARVPREDDSSDAPSDNLVTNDEVTDTGQLEAVFPKLEIVVGSKAEEASYSDESDSKENSDQDQAPPRRRFFPLLYTFRTLLSSLLSEFGDEGGNQDGAFNSSAASNGNMTASEELIKDINATVNGTDGGKKTRFQCSIKNITGNITGEVKIVNSTELLEILNSSKNQKVSTCVLVMFYAPWCHFCARTAPHYNALARAFPQLDVLAVDTSHFSYLNARFGTVAVPNVMLFHARSAVRFNHTTRAFDNFVQFVTNNTGLEPDKNVKLEPKDFLGPLPSIVVRGRDWLLWLAWTFVIMCSTYGFVRSRYGQSFITRLGVLWQEHQHIE